MRIHVVFPLHKVEDQDTKKRILAGVWLDLDEVSELVKKAAHNKSRRAKDGGLHVEIHRIEEI